MIIKLTDAVIKVDLGTVTINAKTAEVITHSQDAVFEPIEIVKTKAEQVSVTMTNEGVKGEVIKMEKKVPLCSSCNLSHECGNQGRAECMNYSPSFRSGAFDPAPGKPAKKRAAKKHKKLTKQEPKFGICVDCGAPAPGKKRCEGCNIKKYPGLRNK